MILNLSGSLWGLHSLKTYASAVCSISMYKLLIIVIFFSTGSFTHKNGDELPKIIRANEARGIDSLLGMKKIAALPLLAKYHPVVLGGYFYKSEILKIENFNKWQHIATLYVYIDSNDQVCKMNYYFTNELPANIAISFNDNMQRADPHRIHKSNREGLSIITIGTSWNAFVLQDDDYSEIRRIFWEQQKPFVKVIYSVKKLSEDKINQCTGQIFYNDIYEPKAYDPNMLCGDSTLHN